MLKLPHNRVGGQPLGANLRQAALAWQWRMNRRRRALTHVAAAARPGLSPLRTGLVGYFNLDESGDDPAIDSAGGMGDLDVYAPFVSASTAGPGAHLARTTVNEFGDHTGWRQRVNFNAFAGAPFSINFWIRQDTNGGQYPFDCTGGSPQGFTCFLATDGMYVNLYSFNAEEYQSPGTISTSGTYGEWVMFTLVWTGAEYCYYENGSLIGTDAFSQPGFDVGSVPFEISASFLPVEGAMALFGLWGRELTGVEVEELFNGGDGLSFAEL